MPDKPTTLPQAKPSRWRRPALAAVVIAAVIGGGIGLIRNRPIAVEVVAPQSNVPIRVFGLGTVEARVVSKVGFEIGATLVELKADHGDRVAKGTVLARLATGEQEAKVAKAVAAQQLAEGNIKKAEASLEKARAVLAQKIEANKRKQTLAGRSIVSEQSAEEALRDEAVAKADVALAQSEGEAAKAQVADARAQLQFEETMLRHRTLVAPFDAIVVERLKEPGTVIKAGDPIYTLVAVDSYWGLAYVDEARAGYIEEGQTVEARLRSRPLDTFHGKVVRIALESDRATEERRVYLRGDKPPARVFLGEQAEFWITVAQLPKALMVPEAAVHGFDGRTGRVWTVENGVLQRRPVDFRHRSEDARLEIASGLPDGAQVVAKIVPGLEIGRRARLVDVKPAGAKAP